jgi:hypothetical protein
VRLDRANDPDTNVFGDTQYFMHIRTHLKRKIEYIKMKSTSTVLFNPNERHSGHHWWCKKGRGMVRKKTVKSITMEENQSTLKRMNCKLSSLEILECIRQQV